MTRERQGGGSTSTQDDASAKAEAESPTADQQVVAIEAPGQNSMQSSEVQDALATTLSHIVSQLDVLSQTMALMEERMTITEDHVRRLGGNVKG